MSRFDLYRQEVYDFLSSLTIKFDELGVIRNNELQYSYPVNRDDRSTWAYYLNLSGQYHVSNEMMTVISIDTDETINFTVDNLDNHPKTRQLYRIGNKAYKELQNRYPEQIDLIRSIVYPVDINTLINANDFTLLSYDDSYLDPNERDDIVKFVKQYLLYSSERWYIDSFNYEELYPIAFWAILWYNLPLAVFSRRIENLHTVNVHKFHIWEYLQSKGLKDYRDILTREQSLFLYRNINYINKNRGKEKTLLLLAENLLKPLRVALQSKKIYHNTADSQETCLWTPEILSDNIVDYTQPTIVSDQYETISSINSRMVTAGIEVDNSAEYVEQVTTKLSVTNKNILPTKLVEIAKYIIDNKYANLLNHFIFETFVYRVANNKSYFDVTISIEVSGTTLVISAKDAFALLYYSIYKTKGESPIDLPNKMSYYTAYKDFTKPTVLPKTFVHAGYEHSIRNYIDVDGIMDSIRYTNSVLDYDETTDLVIDQFIAMVGHVKRTRTSASTMVNKAMETLYRHIADIHHDAIELSTYSTYIDWLAHNPNIQSLVDEAETSIDIPAYYDIISTAIMDALFPFTDEEFKKYISSTDVILDKTYDSFKELFIQLCSYNITFLDTNRDSAMFVMMSAYGMDTSTTEVTDNIIDPMYDNVLVDYMSIESIGFGAGNYPVEVTSYKHLDEFKYTVSVDCNIVPIETQTINIFKFPLDVDFSGSVEVSHSKVDVTCKYAMDALI